MLLLEKDDVLFELLYATCWLVSLELGDLWDISDQRACVQRPLGKSGPAPRRELATRRVRPKLRVEGHCHRKAIFARSAIMVAMEIQESTVGIK